MKVPRYRCRKCHFKLNEDVIEEHFLRILNTLIVRPEELRAEQDVDGSIAEKEGRLDLLRREMKKIDARIDTLVDLVGDQTLDRPSFTERFLPLKERKENIQNELPRIQAEIDHLKTSATAKEYLLEQATTFASMWPVLNDKEKRKLSDELISSIEIREETLHFRLAYTPPFRLLGKGGDNPRGSSPPPS
jgi:site-specific DNA recombinase